MASPFASAVCLKDEPVELEENSGSDDHLHDEKANSCGEAFPEALEKNPANGEESMMDDNSDNTVDGYDHGLTFEQVSEEELGSATEDGFGGRLFQMSDDLNGDGEQKKPGRDKIVVLNKDTPYRVRQGPDPALLKYSCSKCDKGFQFPYQVRRHMKAIHEGKYPYQCEQCKKPFTSVSSWKDHITYVHSDLRRFVCDLCNKGFKMSAALKKHRQEFHEKGAKMRFQCEYCNKIFSTKTNLVKHFVVHSEDKPFECPTCGKCFNRKNNLSEHMVIHSTEKSFECKECGKCFNRAYSLKIHSRNHLTTRPYRCEFCPSSFSQLGALKSHRRLHTGERPFKCEFCDQAFVQQATLQIHVKRHKKEKDFQCPFCPKSFYINRCLIEHLRVHTGEKPFPCAFCAYRTAVKQSLNHHLRNVHKQQIGVTDAKGFLIPENINYDTLIKVGFVPRNCSDKESYMNETYLFVDIDWRGMQSDSEGLAKLIKDKETAMYESAEYKLDHVLPNDVEVNVNESNENESERAAKNAKLERRRQRRRERIKAKRLEDAKRKEEANNVPNGSIKKCIENALANITEEPFSLSDNVGNANVVLEEVDDINYNYVIDDLNNDVDNENSIEMDTQHDDNSRNDEESNVTEVANKTQEVVNEKQATDTSDNSVEIGQKVDAEKIECLAEEILSKHLGLLMNNYDPSFVEAKFKAIASEISVSVLEMYSDTQKKTTDIVNNMSNLQSVTSAPQSHTAIKQEPDDSFNDHDNKVRKSVQNCKTLECKSREDIGMTTKTSNLKSETIGAISETAKEHKVETTPDFSPQVIETASVSASEDQSQSYPPPRFQADNALSQANNDNSLHTKGTQCEYDRPSSTVRSYSSKPTSPTRSYSSSARLQSIIAQHLGYTQNSPTPKQSHVIIKRRAPLVKRPVISTELPKSPLQSKHSKLFSILTSTLASPAQNGMIPSSIPVTKSPHLAERGSLNKLTLSDYLNAPLANQANGTLTNAVIEPSLPGKSATTSLIKTEPLSEASRSSQHRTSGPEGNKETSNFCYPEASGSSQHRTSEPESSKDASNYGYTVNQPGPYIKEEPKDDY
ncbi:uncharacterized protein LOC128209886 [Mya arenaria]|uniref:uncharacterized protein LOC128209886 n=1 Tax=Mya arenaria TaxID=6604 RepID=UPI0022E14944|nr:uncharacterized protein LOC128209886 [Mya arenaria]